MVIHNELITNQGSHLQRGRILNTNKQICIKLKDPWAKPKGLFLIVSVVLVVNYLVVNFS